MRHVKPFVMGLVSTLLAVSVAAPAWAQAPKCRSLYEQAFSTLSVRDFRAIASETSPADLQLKIDAEVYTMFGDRPQVCEEGAYSLFLERFQRFAVDALRAPKDEKTVKVRAAIAAIHQSPISLDSSQAMIEAASFRPTFWTIRSVAQETGMTPVVKQLLENMESVGPPVAAPRSADSPPPVRPEPVQQPERRVTPAQPTPPTPVDRRVERISVPTEPLPGWAVVSLYEIEELAKRNDAAPIVPKVQAILNWMRAVAPPAPQQ